MTFSARLSFIKRELFQTAQSSKLPSSGEREQKKMMVTTKLTLSSEHIKASFL